MWATLSAIRDIGFNYVELAGTYGWPVRELKTRLDTLGLQVSGSHLGLDVLEGDLERIIDDHYTLDCRYLILPWVSSADWADGWNSLGRRLDAIGERIREAGLWFAYHNHAFEFAKQGDLTGLEVLLDSSSPDHVLAELDVGWINYAGLNPAETILETGSRARLIHLKDFKASDPGEEAIDCVAGEGMVDWPQVLGACAEVDAEFGVIEMDHPPGDAIDSVRKCARFFVEQGLSF